MRPSFAPYENYDNYGSGQYGMPYGYGYGSNTPGFSSYGSQGFTPGFSGYGNGGMGGYGYGAPPQNFGQWFSQGGSSAMGGALGGLLGHFLGGGQSPMQAASPYMQQIPGMLQSNLNQFLSPYISQGQNVDFSPYMQAGAQGRQTLGTVQNQLSSMMQNPAAFLQKMGSGFQADPGYNWNVKQMDQAANQAAAAGGMVGSPAEQQSLANNIGQMANQNYQQYLGNAMNTYGQGLSGLTNLGEMQNNQALQLAQMLQGQGFGASMGGANMMTQGLSAYLNSMAQMAAAQAQQQNQQAQGMGGGIGALIGSIIPHL